MNDIFETDLGVVFTSNHAKDRIERHGIDYEYVASLFDRIEGWIDDHDGRLVGHARCDGVEWKLVIDDDDNENTRHDWDLVTVAPEDVDMDVAESVFGEVAALNLALYSD